MSLKSIFITFSGLFLLSACSATTLLLQPPLPEPIDSGLSEGVLSSGVEVISDGRVTAILYIDGQSSTPNRLKEQLRSKMIGDLNEVGVDDLNRKLDGVLGEEFKLAVMNGGEYEGLVKANYAVIATFIESSYSVSYDKPLKMPWTDPEEYKKKQGSCDYEVTVHIGVKIKEISAPARAVKMISTRTVKTINVKETKKASTRTRDQSCASVPETEQRALARSATEDAAACLTEPLQQFLAPRGRISGDFRVDEKGRYFFPISAGKEGGLKAGDHVQIFNITIVGEHDRRERQISEGHIHKNIGPTHAWVLLNDESEALEIQKGDVARVSYESKIAGSTDWVKCRSIRTES